MLRHEFCVLAGESVLSLGISRGENIVPDNQEIVFARRQDNAFSHITVDSETHMSQNGFGFNGLALRRKPTLLRTMTKQIKLLIYFILLSYRSCKARSLYNNTFVELLSHSFMKQPLQNQPLCSNTSNTGHESKA
jgi:hypothetical protein